MAFTPMAYVDLAAEKSSVAIHVRASQVVQALHVGFGRDPGRFALALPDYSASRSVFGRVRVWSESADALIQLLQSHTDIAKHYRPGFPVVLNHKHQGEWVGYFKFNKPGRKKSRADGEAGMARRLRRLQEAEDKALPYLWLHSVSTGQRYQLTIEEKIVSPGEIGSEVASGVDSFGLSTKTRALLLPHLR